MYWNSVESTTFKSITWIYFEPQYLLKTAPKKKSSSGKECAEKKKERSVSCISPGCSYIKLLPGSFQGWVYKPPTGTFNPHPANLTHNHLKPFMVPKAKLEGADEGQRHEELRQKTDRGGTFSFSSENEGSCGFSIMIPHKLITTFALLSNGCLPAANSSLSPLSKSEEKLHQIWKRGEQKRVLLVHVHTICRQKSAGQQGRFGLSNGEVNIRERSEEEAFRSFRFRLFETQK